MATLTFTSGVHVGQRDDSLPWEDWFASSPTTQFSSFTLSSANAVRTGPQSVSGHAGLRGQPIVWQVDRRARDVLTASLAAVQVEDLLGGRPRTTLSGFRDAVARSGFLCNVAWTERRNSGGTESFSVWGVAQVLDASVRGLTESLQVQVWPCDLLFWTGSGTCFLTPTAYASLIGGS